MEEKLYSHLKKFVKIKKSDFSEILSYFKKKTVKKKEILMNEGQQCKSNYFVVSGCLHMFFTTEKGVEQTIQFGLENWWLTDSLSFFNQSSTAYNIQAVEDSEILILDYEKQQELFFKFPVVEKYFRIIYQIAYGAAIQRTKYIFSCSKEEIYFNFKDEFPEFVNRVPQYLLASFLGLTPEYVSKLRNKSVS